MGFLSELLLCSADPYDTSFGSLQLISIKPLAAQPSYSQPASSDRSQDSAIVNGEVMHIEASIWRDARTNAHRHEHRHLTKSDRQIVQNEKLLKDIFHSG